MARKHNIVSIKLSQVIWNATENVRDPEKDYQNIRALMNDIRDNGQKEPVVLRKLPDGYHPIRGFRRTFAIIELLKLYPEGFDYTDEKGVKTHRAFDTVDAIIVDDISDDEAFLMMIDHGNVESLSAVGLHISMMRAAQRSKSEKWCVNTLRGLLDMRHPIAPSKAKEMKDKVMAKMSDIKPESPNYPVMLQAAEEDVYFQFRRGLVQGVYNVNKSPIIVQDAYLKKMRGEQAWPSDKEVSESLKIYLAEHQADSLNISKANPGPKFLEYWENLVKAKTENPTNGTRGKSVSMMSRSECDTLVEGLFSKCCKVIVKGIKRELSRDAINIVDQIMVLVEKEPQGEIAKLLASLDEVVKAPVVAEEAAE